MNSHQDSAPAADQTKTTGTAPWAPTWPNVATDYHGALIRLATRLGCNPEL